MTVIRFAVYAGARGVSSASDGSPSMAVMSDPYDEQRASSSPAAEAEDVGVASGVTRPEPTVSPEVLHVDHEGCLRRRCEEDEPELLAADSSPLSPESRPGTSLRRRMYRGGRVGYARASRGVHRCSTWSGSGDETSPDESEGGRGKSTTLHDGRVSESFDELRFSMLMGTVRRARRLPLRLLLPWVLWMLPFGFGDGDGLDWRAVRAAMVAERARSRRSATLSAVERVGDS